MSDVIGGTVDSSKRIGPFCCLSLASVKDMLQSFTAHLRSCSTTDSSATRLTAQPHLHRRGRFVSYVPLHASHPSLSPNATVQYFSRDILSQTYPQHPKGSQQAAAAIDRGVTGQLHRSTDFFTSRTSTTVATCLETACPSSRNSALLVPSTAV
jgi:hypothetical protein